MTLGAVYSQMSEHNLAIDCFKRHWSSPTKKLRNGRFGSTSPWNMKTWAPGRKPSATCTKRWKKTLNETAVYELPFATSVPGNPQAASFYEQFRKQPYSFAAWYSMGNALQQCGRYTQAIDAYDFAIAIERHSARAYHQKAEPCRMDGTKRAAHLRRDPDV